MTIESIPKFTPVSANLWEAIPDADQLSYPAQRCSAIDHRRLFESLQSHFLSRFPSKSDLGSHQSQEVSLPPSVRNGRRSKGCGIVVFGNRTLVVDVQTTHPESFAAERREE